MKCNKGLLSVTQIAYLLHIWSSGTADTSDTVYTHPNLPTKHILPEQADPKNTKNTQDLWLTAYIVNSADNADTADTCR